MKEDKLGDRMKMYEGLEAGRRLMPLLPIVARMDGQNFSKFTRGMTRPFDDRMTACMVATTAALVGTTGALIGYTQSDEITLVWDSPFFESINVLWFDGKIQKMCSSLAARATSVFVREAAARLPTFVTRMPTFDARIWNVPNKVEACNALLWRELDAERNSVQSAAAAMFTEKEMHRKHGGDLKLMLREKGIEWDDYPTFFKRGTYVRRETESRPFTAGELQALPAKHAAQSNPNLTFERSHVVPFDMPRFWMVKNKVGVVFDREAPEVPEL